MLYNISKEDNWSFEGCTFFIRLHLLLPLLFYVIVKNDIILRNAPLGHVPVSVFCLVCPSIRKLVILSRNVKFASSSSIVELLFFIKSNVPLEIVHSDVWPPSSNNPYLDINILFLSLMNAQ